MAPAALVAAFVLSSPAFAAGHRIPVRYSCDGADVSPPLRWTAPPAGTRSLTLTVVDVSTSPPFRHWTLTGIAAGTRALATGTHVGHATRNSFGDRRYDGPCPPKGEMHRYRFRLAALGSGRRLLARATLVGTYRR